MNVFSNELQVYCLSDIEVTNYCFSNLLLKYEVGGTHNFMLSFTDWDAFILMTESIFFSLLKNDFPSVVYE